MDDLIRCAAGIPTPKKNPKVAASGDVPAVEPEPAEGSEQPSASYSPKDWLKQYNRDCLDRKAACFRPQASGANPSNSRFHQ
jgi:hypothetical protein